MTTDRIRRSNSIPPRRGRGSRTVVAVARTCGRIASAVQEVEEEAEEEAEEEEAAEVAAEAARDPRSLVRRLYLRERGG